MKERKIGILLLSSFLTAFVLILMALYIFTPEKGRMGSNLDAYGRYSMHAQEAMTNALSDTMSQKRSYWISRDAVAAPVPNPDCFGETGDPASLQWLLDEASDLLEGQDLFFSTDTEILSGSTVHYYLDDTILAIVWKEVHDHAVYTFAEVKIAHPSQFRRFLAGGEYGSNKQYTTTEMAQSVNAVVASSGDFYMFRGSGIVVYDGIVRRARNGVSDTCFIDENGDMILTGVYDYMDMDKAQRFVDDNKILFSLTFGPTLVLNGEIVTPREYKLGEINDNFPRACLGQRDKLHYVVAVVNEEGPYKSMPNIHTFAKRIKDTGCPNAYALDGGQTAVISVDGELTSSVMYGYQRKISDIIYFATAMPYGGH